MHRWQSYGSGKLFRPLALVLMIWAVSEACPSLLGRHLWPGLELSAATAFADVGPQAVAPAPMMYAGLFDWFKSKLKRDDVDPEQLRRDQLRQLQMLHDREHDQAKKGEYDRRIIELLDPYADLEKIRALQAEIQQHQQEMQQRGREQQRAEAIKRAKDALQEKRYADAERAADLAIEQFDDAEARQLREVARTRRLVDEAKTLLVAHQVDQALEKNQQALQQYPKDPEAQNLQRNIAKVMEKRKALWVLKALLMAVLVAGMAVGLFLLLRTREWLLEGVEGPCQEKIFPLDKDEIKIGALGPPQGECDLVIRDAGRRIAALHCMLVRSGRHWYLMNESTSGTMLNDEEVEKGSMVRLRRGDWLALAGEAVLVFRAK